MTLSLWSSLDAIRALAGDSIEATKHYDFDPHYLLELEPTVVESSGKCT
jgi:hypothetical protein